MFRSVGLLHCCDSDWNADAKSTPDRVMMASCVVTLSKSRFDRAPLSRQPNSALNGELLTFLRISIGNKLCSRSARFTASTSAALMWPRLDVARLRFGGVNELHVESC